MIHVVLADDDELIREALASLLGREDDIRVVATSADGHRAVHTAIQHRPDVLVADLVMPHLDGLGVVRELARVQPECAVVILTDHGSPLQIRRALESGARGFLAKGAPGPALADVIRRVRAGSRYVDPVLAADALTAPPSPLTPRETEVLAAAGPDGRVVDGGQTERIPENFRRIRPAASIVASMGSAYQFTPNRHGPSTGTRLCATPPGRRV